MVAAVVFCSCRLRTSYSCCIPKSVSAVACAPAALQDNIKTAIMSTECCDVIVAHSPPIFTGHRSSQPNLQSSVCIYKNLRLAVTQKPSQKSSPVPVRRYVNTNSRGSTTMSPTRSADNKFPQSGQQGSSQTPKPRRPCLVIRTDSEGSIGSSSSSGSSSDENEPSSPIRRKKKVVFADDRGLSLTQVSTSALNVILCADRTYSRTRTIL